MIPQNFLWSDGPRPTLDEVDSYVALSALINIDLDILQLQDPTNAKRWDDDILIQVSEALRNAGIRVHWMLWAKTDETYCHEQLDYLDRLYQRFVPNGVQWDAEEQWRQSGPYESCAQILDAGLEHLNDLYWCEPEYSVTATTNYPRPTFAPKIEYLLSRKMFTAGYAMAYAFYAPKDDHWSHDLPKDVTKTVRLISMAWIDAVQRGVLKTCYIGLAAYYQNFPPDYGIEGLDGMLSCIGEVYQLSDDNPATIRGQGWWSRKHVTRHTDKQTMIYNASQDPRSGRPLTPLPTDDPPPDDNAVKQLQAVLTIAGYDPGPIDGIDGPKTRAAVLQYETEKARVTTAQAGGADELIAEVYGPDAADR